MKFGPGDVDGSQVEDRRGGGGMRIGAGAGGLGVVGLVAYMIINAFSSGRAPTAEELERLRQAAQQRGSSNDNGTGAATGSKTTPIVGSCEGVTSKTDPAKFIACVETNIQSFWKESFDKRGKGQYVPSKLVLFTDSTTSGCGSASASTGPFYCPADKKVFLDLGFFRELETRFGAQGGDFAEAYVIAHEYGHHVQDLLGRETKMREEAARHPSDQNALSVKLELQADCYAGVWGHGAYAKGTVEKDEIAQALDAASAVGDDRIQKEMRGRVQPETFTHGSSAMRQKWFGVGMSTGDPSQCDTFGE